MCRELESELVEINDATENEFLKSTAELLKSKTIHVFLLILAFISSLIRKGVVFKGRKSKR